MFYGCMWLKEAPELPAMNLAEYCYAAMFSECICLTQAPALPATTLANYCYGDMFTDCTGLTRLPELPATNLAEYCYQNMFAGCSGIALHANGTAPTWGIPADATEKTGWNTGMLAETGGTFTGDPAIGAIYHYSPLPAPGAYLTFSSTNAFTITPKFDSLEGALSASTDALNWVEFTTNGAAAADNGSGEYRLYICGWGNSRIPAGHYQPGWAIDAPTGTVACSGNIETLLDHDLGVEPLGLLDRRHQTGRLVDPGDPHRRTSPGGLHVHGETQFPDPGEDLVPSLSPVERPERDPRAHR